MGSQLHKDWKALKKSADKAELPAFPKKDLGPSLDEMEKWNKKTHFPSKDLEKAQKPCREALAAIAIYKKHVEGFTDQDMQKTGAKAVRDQLLHFFKTAKAEIEECQKKFTNHVQSW